MRFESKNMVSIIKASLNMVDDRLINHGDRVAYIVEKLMFKMNKYDDRTIFDFCMMALLHDIGAYKNSEIDDLFIFENRKNWNHAIYGSLFLKYLSPLGKLADGVKYHHLFYSDFKNHEADENVAAAAMLIRLADGVEIGLRGGKSHESVIKSVQECSGTRYNPEYCELFTELAEKDGILNKLSDYSYTNDSVINLRIHLHRNEIKAYLRMLALFIDFHSEFTVLHTIAVVSLSCTIARHMGLSDDEIEKIYIGAMLHDLGKIAVPVSILEKPARLTDEEMNIMREHVVYSEEIIKPYIDDDICKIAVRHHERMDGSGYPRGITGDKFTLSEKIVMVSDVASALHAPRSYKEAFGKDVIINELQLQKNSLKLPGDVVDFVCDNFDVLAEDLTRSSDETHKMYSNIQTDVETETKKFIEGNYFI